MVYLDVDRTGGVHACQQVGKLQPTWHCVLHVPGQQVQVGDVCLFSLMRQGTAAAELYQTLLCFSATLSRCKYTDVTTVWKHGSREGWLFDADGLTSVMHNLTWNSSVETMTWPPG